jgi:hypothetical protein
MTHHGGSSADGGVGGGGAGVRSSAGGGSAGAAAAGATVKKLRHFGQHKHAPSAPSGTFILFAQKEQAVTNAMAHPKWEGDPVPFSFCGRLRADSRPWSSPLDEGRTQNLWNV